MLGLLVGVDIGRGSVCGMTGNAILQFGADLY